MRRILSSDLCCCLLPQCKALCTCCSGFPTATPLSNAKHTSGPYLRNLKKLKEKGTFAEVGKLLKDSCRCKHTKILSSKSNIEQLLCKQMGIVFWVKCYEHIVGTRKACGERLDFTGSLRCLKILYIHNC